MRVALVSNWALPIGGSQIYAAELAERLAWRHEVLMLSGSADVRIAGSELVSVPHLRPLHPGESDARKAIWHLRDQWRPRVHQAIKRELRRFRPDVVHTHELQGLSAAVFSALATGEAAHVHTAHDLNLLCLRTTMTLNGRPCGGRCAPCLLQRTVRSRLAARRLDRLIAPSDYMRDIHVDFGVADREAAVTIRQPARDGPARHRHPTQDALQVGFMGNLARHKGVLTLLEAFRSAPGNWRLHFAGDGLLAGEVQAACASDARVTHHGFVTGPQKDSFFDRLDVLVVPSEYEENAPLTAAEALVRGVPCVVSDRGGLPETPEAWRFQAGNAGSLLTVLQRLADEPQLLSHASETLLGRREEFLWPLHIERIESVYSAAIDAGSRGNGHVRYQR